MDKQVSARMPIRKGKLDGLQRQAAAIVRHTKKKDAKTLGHDWFLKADKTACEVREAYGMDRMPGHRRSRRAEP